MPASHANSTPIAKRWAWDMAFPGTQRDRTGRTAAVYTRHRLDGGLNPSLYRVGGRRRTSAIAAAPGRNVGARPWHRLRADRGVRARARVRRMGPVAGVVAG